jgi:hypothetical protein
MPVLSATQSAAPASNAARSASAKVAQAANQSAANPAITNASLASTAGPTATCQPADVAVSPQDVRVAMGTVLATYSVRSTGSTVCSLEATNASWLKPQLGAAKVTSVVAKSAQPLAPGAVQTVKVAFQNPAPQAAPAPAQQQPQPQQPSPAHPALPALPSPPALPALPKVPKVTQPPALPPVNPTAPGAPSGLGQIMSSATTIPQPVGQAVNTAAGLVTPTTTRPAPPPPQHNPPQNQGPSGPTTYSSGSQGYDISWPQCGQSYPPSAPVAVVGVNDGRAFTSNPCFTSQAAWAGPGLELYLNINSPNNGADPYNFGHDAAAASVDDAANKGVRARTWWLDVETVGQCGNYWSCDQGANSRTIQGSLDALRNRGLTAGIYSTSYQWGVITGGYMPGGGAPPNWLAGVYRSDVGAYCSGGHNFAGGRTWLTQIWEQSTWDEDQAC